MRIKLTSTLFLLFFLFTNKVYADVVFQDDFNDGNISDWHESRNIQWGNPTLPCQYAGSVAHWNYNTGKIGIRINGPACVTEFIPNNFNLDNIKSYSYEFDMQFTNTLIADRNVIFKYLDGNNWYDLKFYGNRIEFQKQIGSYYKLLSTTYNYFADNGTYHFKIDFINNLIRVYIDNNFVWEITDSEPYITGGTIGMQASVGANPASEVWFDNVKVTSLDNNPSENFLDVPYFNQNDQPWGPSEYDHAVSLGGFSNTLFERWGCAVTSTAMVLRYHKINQFADGTPIDPGSLNQWLNNNKGYLTGYTNGESYSSISWPIIGKLTQDLYKIGKAPVKLMHKRSYNSSILDDDLNTATIPAVLGVSNINTKMHFVVAKGKTDTTYAINDPEWPLNKYLTAFGNTFFQIDRYIPSQTNLSYLVFVVNPRVELLVTDQSGRKTGKNSVTYNEIPNAIYGYEKPINNSGIDLGSGVNSFLLPEPINGEYLVKIIGSSGSDYALNLSTFQIDGVNTVNTINNIVQNQYDAILIEYSQTQPPVINKYRKLAKLISDLFEQNAKNNITKESVYNQLMRTTEQAEKDYNQGRINNFNQKIEHIRSILNKCILEKGTRPTITQDAYNLLIQDLNSL